MIIVAIVVAVIAFGGGFMYFNPSDASTAADTSSVDPSLYSKDVKAFYDAKDRIDFKEKSLSFMKKPFYEKSVDYTVVIPSVKPTGRPNPFVPYVTP